MSSSNDPGGGGGGGARSAAVGRSGRGGGGRGRGSGRGRGGGPRGGRGASRAPGEGANKTAAGREPDVPASKTNASETPPPPPPPGRGGTKRRPKQIPKASKALAAPTTATQPSKEEQERQRHVEAQAKAAEAERVRLQAEQKAAQEAEAARLKAQAAANDRLRNVMDVLQSLVETTSQHHSYRTELAPAALIQARQAFESSKKTLKTDVKKCTAFVKKIKTGTAWTSSKAGADLVQDVASLNLSRYVEEVVQAMLDTKPTKITDLPPMVALSVAMHARYGDFGDMLVPGLWKIVQGKPAAADAETVKARRLYFRLLTEFYQCGLLTDPKPLVRCVAECTGAPSSTTPQQHPNDEAAHYAVQDAHMVVAFARAAGHELLGITPRSVAQALSVVQSFTDNSSSSSDGVDPDAALLQEATPLATTAEVMLQERAVPDDGRHVLVTHCRGAYTTLYQSLVSTHHKLQKLEKRCEQDRLLSGTLPEAREKGLADARKLRESLYKSVETLSDVLDETMPVLPQDDNDDGGEGSTGLEVWTRGDQSATNDYGPFDDEETKSFYCDVPDLLTTTPPGLLGMTVDAIELRKLENARKYGLGDDVASVIMDDESSAPAPMEPAEDGGASPSALMSTDEGDEATSTAEGKSVDKDAPQYKLSVLLDEELPECNRREQLDELSEKFCTNHGSSKSARKRLARALFLVPRHRVDLLPFYARMAATLDRIWPDIAALLVPEVEQQFHGQAKFKKAQNIDARMRTARYVGELTKFRVAPPMVLLRCLRRCLDDFTGPNVDVACCLLESAGRFLYRMKHTSSRVAALMETMTRLAKAKNLDERLQSLIKAAFYSVKPPPAGPRKKLKEYSPLEAYLRQLLLVELDPSEETVAFVAKLVTRMPWADPKYDLGALVTRIMLKASRRGRYKTIHAVAAVASALRTQRSTNELPVRLLDAVIEELRWALEHPDFRDQQRTLTYARLLGDLYSTGQVSAQLLLQELHDFINIGHRIPIALREASERHMTALKSAEHNFATEDAPTFRSVGGITPTINEDEEMEDFEIKDTPLPDQPEKTEPVAVTIHSEFDPRVTSLTDPPDSAFRIKLVCTTLEAAAKKIVTRNNIPALTVFLTAFQRYLFTKSALPIEVELSLLDTFDVIDSQWRQAIASPQWTKLGANSSEKVGFLRYTTWMDAHNATVASEEATALAEERQEWRTAKLADDAGSVGELDASLEGMSLNDESLSQHEEDDESVSLASTKDEDERRDEHLGPENRSDEDVSNGSEDDESTESDASEDESSSSGESYEDEEAYMRQLEEEAFEQELRRVTKEAMERGKTTSRKQVADYMPSGSQFIKKKATVESGAVAPTLLEDGTTRGISFQLLKRGARGKVESRDLYVPDDTNLAKAVSRHDDAAARERDMIKQRVLQYEAHSAEAGDSGGNVYLEQDRLQVIRNRPLSMEDIDRNFGTRGGNLRTSDKGKAPAPAAQTTEPSQPRPGRGRGRGRGRGSSGRNFF